MPTYVLPPNGVLVCARRGSLVLLLVRPCQRPRPTEVMGAWRCSPVLPCPVALSSRNRDRDLGGKRIHPACARDLSLRHLPAVHSTTDAESPLWPRSTSSSCRRTRRGGEGVAGHTACLRPSTARSTCPKAPKRALGTKSTFFLETYAFSIAAFNC